MARRVSKRLTGSVAREADAGGFDAIFSTEVNNDALATAQLMGSATERIQVGTWIANVYLRHSYVCAQGAALMDSSTARYRQPSIRWSGWPGFLVMLPYGGGWVWLGYSLWKPRVGNGGGGGRTFQALSYP